VATAQYVYRRALENMLGGSGAAEARATDYLSDTIKASLHTSSYTPNLDTHETYSDLTNEVTGTLYSAGGATLGSKTITYTAANSWATTWATGTAYTVGAIIRPTSGNGKLYRAITSGASHATTEPVWTTVIGDEQPADNTVTWHCAGSGITVIDSADPSWGPGATISGIRQLAVYNDTPTDKPLLFLAVLDADSTVTNGTFSFTIDPLGWAHFLIP
jgi:hypothetical protein